MIILEGVDKSGKTTLGKMISDKYGDLPVRKFGVPEGNPVPDYVDELYKTLVPKIYDRFLYGEMPYSLVKRPNSVYIRPFQLQMLELILMTIPHVVIYCRPEWDTVSMRLCRDGDDYVNLAELKELYEIYDDMFTQPIGNVKIYDGENLNAILYSITEAMDNDAWLRYRNWRRYGMPGVGKINRPRYLFIGERYNYKAEFQITFWSKSGEYLIQQLKKAGVNLSEAHFTNSISSDIKQLSLEQVLMLNPEKVICLGDVAWQVVSRYRDKLDDMGIPTTKIPHPAYWSRFRSGDEAEYVEGLRIACGL